VDTGHFRDIAAGFFPWLETNAKISDSKKENIQNHIEMHQGAYGLLFKIFIALVYFKESLLQQLNSGQQTFDASINDSPGGEGYVYGEGDDKIKLVRRFEFSRANREKYRK
jgi:hypothetical protein